MIRKRRLPKIFPGWWLVFASAGVGMWGFGYSLFGLSALLKPIATFLKVNRTAMSVPSSISTFEGGFESLGSGWIADRFGPRWPVVAGVFLMGLALILMYFIQSLWQFYVVWGIILGTGSNIAFTVPIRVAIANWFVKKRGTAHGIQMGLQGLSGVLVLPLVAWLIATQGWQMTCVIGGVVMWLVGLPLVWFFIKPHRPEYYGLLPDGVTVNEPAEASQLMERSAKYAAEVGEVDFTGRQILRSSTYWLLIVVQAGQRLAAAAFVLHSIPFLTDRGIDPLVAASILSLMQLSALPARTIAGFLSDRFGKQNMRFIMSGGYLLQAVGTISYLLHPTITMVYVWFVLYGFGSGVGAGIVQPMLGRYFGRRSFGFRMGLQSALTAPVAVVAPIYFGWVYDTTGSYISAFTLSAILLAASGVFAVLIRPAKPPAAVSDAKV